MGLRGDEEEERCEIEREGAAPELVVKDGVEVVKLPIGRVVGENPVGRSLGGIVDEILARREGNKNVVEWVGSCNRKRSGKRAMCVALSFRF